MNSRDSRAAGRPPSALEREVGVPGAQRARAVRTARSRGRVTRDRRVVDDDDVRGAGRMEVPPPLRKAYMSRMSRGRWALVRLPEHVKRTTQRRRHRHGRGEARP